MDRYEKGIKVMRQHLGKDADQYVESIREVAPLFAKINVECAFGDVYGDANSVLDQKQKELCSIAALTVLGHSLPQLKLHVSCALNCGATMDEIVEVITQMILYGGFPAATNAILTAKTVFKEKGYLK
ncbi:MAG: 4-carboxymuconolactone decarboxylase [Gammaproteobacteria bacterium CG_4_10_14_0_8_um_filter_38_16]|nr:MAG: 4-carboxymuconolactone decarboxylase [Gammaproteobacteria bacterium CG_4_10_14_0_8_um_filter_38_16]PJA04177.1 MAG: 4-carboxymuconolactone decarboxylase [Gammaproteobacteria bacterium CG_4_10_14_0_2_um_filter_38_22]PJB09767.1 MAG: 4-carboxymuconolactone decarboxylase [Gammaproteobacteria bacterium CG_4_9_14_3_um_filter_38_9]